MHCVMSITYASHEKSRQTLHARKGYHSYDWTDEASQHRNNHLLPNNIVEIEKDLLVQIHKYIPMIHLKFRLVNKIWEEN